MFALLHFLSYKLSVDEFSRGLYLYNSDDNDVDLVMEVVMMMAVMGDEETYGVGEN